MKKLFKWIVILVGVVAILLVIAGSAIYMMSNASFTRVYTVDPPPVAVPAADSAVLAQGAHLAVIRGCMECHGDNLGGKVFIDDPALGQLNATNLTTGEGGSGARYEDLDWVRAIRHGIDPDGRPLLFMPSHEYYPMGDQDMGALIAYLKQIPPVDNVLAASTVGPLGRALFMAGDLHLVPAELIDHEAPRPEAPAPGVTPEYGEYLALVCMGCHGEGYSGGPIPGVPPDWPPAANITFHESGLASWTEEDFFTLLRTGKRPDGRDLNPQYMPWRAVSHMTDDEIRAMWVFFQSLPHTPVGNR